MVSYWRMTHRWVVVFLAIVFTWVLIADVAEGRGRIRRSMKRVGTQAGLGEKVWHVLSTTDRGSQFETTFIAPPPPTPGQPNGFVVVGGVADAVIDNLLVVPTDTLQDPSKSFYFASDNFVGCDCLGANQDISCSKPPCNLCGFACGAHNEVPRVPVFSGATVSQLPLAERFFNSRDTLEAEGWIFNNFVDDLNGLTEMVLYDSNLSAIEEVQLGSFSDITSDGAPESGSLRLVNSPSGCPTDPFHESCEFFRAPVSNLVPGKRYTVLAWVKSGARGGVFAGAENELWVAFESEIQADADVHLEVVKVGAGSGSVVSQSLLGGAPEIDCGADCVELFDLADPALDDLLVELTATPDAGSFFVGWDGPCVGPEPVCRVGLDEDQQVIAIFETGFDFPNFCDKSDLTFSGDAESICLCNTADIEAECPLVLTPDAQFQAGAVWYDPIATDKIRLADGFEATFLALMENPGDAPAEGLAFVIQNDSPFALGGINSAQGYADDGSDNGIPVSLAVELDPFESTGESGWGHHISVQTNGLAGNRWQPANSLGRWSLANLEVLGGSDPEPLRHLSAEQCGGTSGTPCVPQAVRIRYVPGVLEVYLGGLRQPVLSVDVDLEDIGGQSLLDADGAAWVGFTAGTGAAAQRHEILQWRMVSFESSQHRPFARRVVHDEPLNDALGFYNSISDDTKFSGPQLPQQTWKYFLFDLPQDATGFTVILDDLVEDLDLYIRQGRLPTLDDWDCRPMKYGSTEERCSTIVSGGGRWWIGVTHRGAVASPPTEFGQVVMPFRLRLLQQPTTLCRTHPEVTVPEGPYGTTHLFEACREVRAGVAVKSTGRLILRAGERIVFENGFSVDAGGRLSAGTDPDLVESTP